MRTTRLRLNSASGYLGARHGVPTSISSEWGADGQSQALRFVTELHERQAGSRKNLPAVQLGNNRPEGRPHGYL
jgi:hypothetical protein